MSSNKETVMKWLADAALDVGKGSAVALPIGVSAALINRKLSPVEFTTLPVEEEDFDIVSDKAPKVKKIKKAGVIDKANILNLLGVTAGIGAGVKGTEGVMDYYRSKDLSKKLDEQKKELKSLLLEEQSLAKQGNSILRTPIVDLAADAGSALSNMSSSGSAGRAAHYIAWPTLSAMLGVKEGYELGKSSDPSRARFKELKDSLLQRLGEDAGEGRRSPLRIKFNPKGGKRTPLKPGASALVDPSKGRDIFSI